MNSTLEKFRKMLTRHDAGEAAGLLERMEPEAATEILVAMPFDEQKALFRKFSLNFAAAISGIFPYYHTYVLLHSRPREEMAAIIDRMNPDERMQFIDELPGEAWQQLMDELYEEPPAAPDKAGVSPSVELEKPVAPAAPSAPPIIEARHIEKNFERPDGGQIQVIASTDLSLEPGMIVALLGPSGSGKSTLLRILSGLAQPSAGEVLWHGQSLAGAKPNVAIVFQSFALFPWLTVLENVEVPLLARGMSLPERRQRALKTLASVGLNGFESAYPKELSGGMKQRVGFARALAVEPEILFMDEPFSALDVLTAENLRGELLELWLEKKIPTKSIFVVTHNIEEAVLLGDRIIVLGRNPARIRADFRVPLSHPRERGSPEFLLFVDYIYKLMTQPEFEPCALALAGEEAKPRPQNLPHARRGAIAGLLELLNDRGGKEDLYRIADELHMEVDDLLPLVDAATLLSFATSAQGDVELTEKGREFAEADIPTRKRLFRDAALANVSLLQQMRGALENKSDHSMPLEFFRDLLEQRLSDEEARQQIETALNWGRYGDIITYDADSDRLKLYEPENSSDGAGAARP
jgi:NitT/TauT family transport system ATP-binding protein